jgi:hypothetical protein
VVASVAFLSRLNIPFDRSRVKIPPIEPKDLVRFIKSYCLPYDLKDLGNRYLAQLCRRAKMISQLHRLEFILIPPDLFTVIISSEFLHVSSELERLALLVKYLAMQKEQGFYEPNEQFTEFADLSIPSFLISQSIGTY